MTDNTDNTDNTDPIRYHCTSCGVQLQGSEGRRIGGPGREEIWCPTCVRKHDRASTTRRPPTGQPSPAPTRITVADEMRLTRAILAVLDEDEAALQATLAEASDSDRALTMMLAAVRRCAFYVDGQAGLVDRLRTELLAAAGLDAEGTLDPDAPVILRRKAGDDQ